MSKRLAHLKVKIKSLAAESGIIRIEEAKAMHQASCRMGEKAGTARCEEVMTERSPDIANPGGCRWRFICQCGEPEYAWLLTGPDHGVVAQHGPNPEARRFFPGRSLGGAAMTAWTQAIHDHTRPPVTAP